MRTSVIPLLLLSFFLFDGHTLSAQVPLSGRIAAWYFSGDATDGTGNGYDGTLYGPTLIDDRFGSSNSAYYFDGLNDYIHIPHNSALNCTSSFSISAWVRFCVRQPTPNSTVGPAVLEKFNQLTNTTDYVMLIAQGNRLAAGRKNSSEAGSWQIGSTTLDDGKWHNVITIFNGDDSTVSLYIDGLLDVKSTRQTWLSSFNAGDITIGRARRWKYFNDDGSFFHGAIDDINLYNRALNSNEVLGLFADRGWPATGVHTMATVNVRSLTPPAYCPDDPTPVSLIAEGDFDSVQWSPPMGLTSLNSPNTSAMPLQTTTYTVTAYKFGRELFCSDTSIVFDTITVTIYKGPTIGDGINQYTCAFDTVTLGGSTSGGFPPYSWQWSPVDGLDNPTAEHPRLFVTHDVTYQVVVTDAKGCHDTGTASVSIIPAPSVEIGPDTSYFCMGTDGLPLTAEGSAGNPPFSYTWWPAAGLDRTDSSTVLASPKKPTTYTVEIRDRAGICAGYDSMFVIPVIPPSADAGEEHSLCLGESIRLEGEGSGIPSQIIYQWSPKEGLDDSTIAQPIAEPRISTTYRLRVIDTLTGCFDEDEVRIEVRNIKLRTPSLTVNFGIIDGCRTDSTAILQLFNDGSSDAAINSWKSDLSGISLLNSTATIPAGGSISLRIRFAPGSAGTYNGTFVLHTAPCDDSIVVAVIGEKEHSTVEIHPGEISAPRMSSCELREELLKVLLTNSGTADAEIGVGSVNAPYTILSPSLPTTLNAGDQLEVILQYAPSGAGTFNDELTIPFTSGTCSDTLRVALNGIVEEISPEPEFVDIDFGVLDGCATEADTTISIGNSSSFDITLTDATLPSEFFLLDPLPITIPAHGRTDVHLRYTPTIKGVSGGSITFLRQPCAAELKLNVRGEKRGLIVTLPDTLDFGEIPLCDQSSASLPFTITLNSEGTGDGEVADLTISSPFSTNIVKGSALPDGTAQTYQVSFTPTIEGTYTGELMLYLEPCDIHHRIFLRAKGTRAELTGSGTGYDFGPQPVGSTKSGSAIFRNSGGIAMHVDRVEGILPPFAITSTDPILPADILPGEQLLVNIDYAPVDRTSISPLNAVVTAPCSMTFTIEVRGTGTTAASSTIVLPTLSAAPGENLQLDLRLTEQANLDAVQAIDFQAEVAFDASLLTVTDGTPERIENRQRIITVNGTRQSGSDLLASVELTATLGHEEKTPLQLISFKWIGATAPVVIDTLNGEFTLLGLCRDGGVRLYDPDGNIRIKAISPNPTSGNLRIIYGLSERGLHRLQLVDGTGKVVREIFNGQFVPGEYELNTSVHGISSGFYYLVLETPSLMLTHKIEVVR